MLKQLTGGLVTVAAAALVTLPLAVQAQEQEARPERIVGHPNLNGIWQAFNNAYWNLEAHSATALDDFWELGAIGAIPAGLSVVREGEIPYLPEARAQRDENRAGWPAADPVTKCYMPGIPRATYMPFPFQIFQGDRDILFVYPFASTNRIVYMSDHMPPPVDTWMGRSNGQWEGDTLVIETRGFNGRQWLDRSGNHHSRELVVTERFSLIDPNHIQYEATLEDPNTYSSPWTIEMTLYRHIEPDAQLLEYKCVPFVDKLLYQDLLGLDADNGGEQAE